MHRHHVTEAAQAYLNGQEAHEFQYQVCEALLANRNVLLVAPTGMGKSLCYQIATRLNQRSTLVVSPLIALMDDQAKASAQLGFKVGQLHSGVDPACQWSAISRWMTGEPQILYTSPERLLSHSFARCLKTSPPGLVVIDEAHCVSTWGRKFRPAYRRLSELIRTFPNTPVLAMTATARKAIQLDIAETLQLRDPVTVNVPLRLSNTDLAALHASTGAERAAVLADFASNAENLPLVIFCVLRRHCEDVADQLKQLGHAALAYHAGMPTAARKAINEAFQSDPRSILVATSAYEMGINNRNIRSVIHYGLPASMESYVQAVGRAGRDGRPAQALLLFADTDLDILDSMEALAARDTAAPGIEPLNIASHEMYAYALTKSCRIGFLKGHFHSDAHQISPDFCGQCDNCLKQARSPEISNHRVISGKLKKWRKNAAARLGKPCFAILTDRELALIVRHWTTDEVGLLHIPGIRRSVIQNFHGEIMTTIRDGAEDSREISAFPAEWPLDCRETPGTTPDPSQPRKPSRECDASSLQL